jgi:RNA polymerase sigma factor (sigma-70 family)
MEISRSRSGETIMSRSALAASVRQLRSRLAAQNAFTDSDEQLLHAFLTNRDDNAFATLVHRHGSMVLHVCRRVLGHQQDAEDAFQATFLVLARNAAKLQKQSSLASFLHGIAYRTALKAKRAAARRRRHEGQAPTRHSINPAEELTWREVQALLDEETAQLPERYKSAFILCCLQELSLAEAAQRLGVKEGTVSSRLTVARKRLQRRLTRRGVELTAVLSAMALATASASALPAELMANTVKAALATATGERLTCSVSASVVELMEATSVMLSNSKTKAALMLLLAATLLGGAGLWIIASPQATLAPPSSPKTTAQHPPQADTKVATDTFVLHGWVVGPDNKPVVGVTLYLPRWSKEHQEQKDIAVVRRGVTDKDGRFRLELPRRDVQSGKDVSLVASADGFGLAWIDLPKQDPPGEITLQLVKDVPIRGRLVTTEGRPVSGVTVTVAGIVAFDRLDDFLRVFQREMHHSDEGTGARWLNLPLNDVLLVKPTDKDGRFEIKGIGVERLVGLEVKSAALAESPMLVVTRERFDAKAYLKDAIRGRGERAPLIFGPSFEHVIGRAEANRAIEGTVREAGNGKPVAGAAVHALGVSARTDALGRFRLVGMRMAPAPNSFLQVSAPENTTLIGRYQHVQASAAPGGKLERVDIELLRGVVVTGRVYDKATGKGVRNCSVHFSALPENKTAQTEGLALGSMTGEDGRYRLVTITGPGVLLASVPGTLLKIDGVPIYPYKSAEFDAADRRRVQMTDRMKPYRAFLVAGGGMAILDHDHACKVLDIKDDGKPVTCDLALDPGKTLTVQLEDPERKPLAGAMVAGISTLAKRMVPLKSATCTIYALDPKNPRSVAFLHTERKLAALVTLRGDEKEPVKVRLGPTGTLTGRIVDADGKPVAGAEIYMHYATPLGTVGTSFTSTAGFSLRDRPPQTNKEGRFRLDTIVPGLTVADFRLLKGRQLLETQTRLQVKPLQSGETFDLGDIRTKPRQP